MADGAGDKWSTPQELAATRAEVWLPGLGRLSPGYDVVPITDDVREFLRMDGIMLPPPPPGHVLKERDPRYESPEGAEGGLSLDEFPDSPGAESGADADASSEASSLKPPPPLAEFQVAISGVFEAHGPMLLPRLSWVTPWDGAWMNGEEAQCGSVGEVLTVLKASDAVTEAMGTEVDAPPPGGVLGPPNASLVLLDFDDVFARPERCFRAFVRGGHLLALSQLRATRFLPEAKALREVAVGAAESLIDAVSGRGIDIGAADAVFLNTCELLRKPGVHSRTLSVLHALRLLAPEQCQSPVPPPARRSHASGACPTRSQADLPPSPAHPTTTKNTLLPPNIPPAWGLPRSHSPRCLPPQSWSTSQ